MALSESLPKSESLAVSSNVLIIAAWAFARCRSATDRRRGVNECAFLRAALARRSAVIGSPASVIPFVGDILVSQVVRPAECGSRADARKVRFPCIGYL